MIIYVNPYRVIHISKWIANDSNTSNAPWTQAWIQNLFTGEGSTLVRTLLENADDFFFLLQNIVAIKRNQTLWMNKKKRALVIYYGLVEEGTSEKIEPESTPHLIIPWIILFANFLYLLHLTILYDLPLLYILHLSSPWLYFPSILPIYKYLFSLLLSLLTIHFHVILWLVGQTRVHNR